MFSQNLIRTIYRLSDYSPVYFPASNYRFAVCKAAVSVTGPFHLITFELNNILKGHLFFVNEKYRPTHDWPAPPLQPKNYRPTNAGRQSPFLLRDMASRYKLRAVLSMSQSVFDKCSRPPMETIFVVGTETPPLQGKIILPLWRSAPRTTAPYPPGRSPYAP